ncbi:hypothetical protein Tco_0465175 [Tanacetum coccineum]
MSCWIKCHVSQPINLLGIANVVIKDVRRVRIMLLEVLDAWNWLIYLGTDIQKESQKRPNQARDGKDKVNPKPKSVKVKSQSHEENTT